MGILLLMVCLWGEWCLPLLLIPGVPLLRVLLHCIHLVLCGGWLGLAKGPGFHSSAWGGKERFVIVLEAEEKSLCAAIPADCSQIHVLPIYCCTCGFAT